MYIEDVKSQEELELIMGQTVQVPPELIEKFEHATEAFDELQDAFEDFLIAHNPAILRRLRKARREQLAGKTRPWEEFKRELDRKSRHKR
jgi:hypothetical protein